VVDLPLLASSVVEEILNVAERQRVLHHVHHHHETDHFGRAAEITEGVGRRGYAAAVPALCYRVPNFGLTEPFGIVTAFIEP
jgi:hypothetical protein